jgi:ADP-ribose pyrophosphatase
MEPPERTIESQRVFQGRVVTLRVDTVALPNGRTARREVVEHSQSVTILLVDGQGNVLLEAPAGGMNEGEDPEAAARRELREETGYTARKMEHLASFYVSPGFCTELMRTYLATGLMAGRADPEEDEHIQVISVPLRRAIQMISTGEIADGKTIAALLLAEKRLNISS